MGSVTSCVLWLIYNALRLHCWGCRCVSTCQREIILSQSLTKSFLWFTFVVSLLELFEFWSFHREIPACDSMRCSGSELWSYCAASRRTVDWLQETFEVFQLISTSFAMKTRHCWNLLEVKMMSATFISKMNCKLRDLLFCCSPERPPPSPLRKHTKQHLWFTLQTQAHWTVGNFCYHGGITISCNS